MRTLAHKRRQRRQCAEAQARSRPPCCIIQTPITTSRPLTDAVRSRCGAAHGGVGAGLARRACHLSLDQPRATAVRPFSVAGRPAVDRAYGAVRTAVAWRPGWGRAREEWGDRRRDGALKVVAKSIERVQRAFSSPHIHASSFQPGSIMDRCTLDSHTCSMQGGP